MSLETIYTAVLDGNANAAKEAAQTALDAGISAETILNDACIPAMTEVGHLFEIGDKFVPEMLISARAMSAVNSILKPILASEGVEQIGTVVVGTVAGDMHDIGKNLVAMMMEGAGFKIVDLGTDVQPAAFVASVTDENPDIIAMSALLTTTMKSIPTTIEALKAAGVRDRVKIMVGGAPVTQDFADKIGADGFAADAGSAARNAKAMLGIAV